MSVVAAVLPFVLVVGGSGPAPYAGGPVSPPYLPGMYSQEEFVPYPASLGAPFEGSMPLDQSVAVGVVNAELMQGAAPGPVTFIGTSQGSLVLDQVMRDDMAAHVPASKVSFVVIENPEGTTGALTALGKLGVPFQGYKAKPAPVTPYSVTNIVVQYDGVADFPTYPLNLVADINAALGAYYLHPTAQYTNLATVPKADITTSTNVLGGVTTNYLVPTRQLPITRFLGQLGVPKPVLKLVNKVLRPIVDAGYDRKPPAQMKPSAAKSTAAVKATKKQGGHTK